MKHVILVIMALLLSGQAFAQGNPLAYKPLVDRPPADLTLGPLDVYVSNETFETCKNPMDLLQFSIMHFIKRSGHVAGFEFTPRSKGIAVPNRDARLSIAGLVHEIAARARLGYEPLNAYLEDNLPVLDILRAEFPRKTEMTGRSLLVGFLGDEVLKALSEAAKSRSLYDGIYEVKRLKANPGVEKFLLKNEKEGGVKTMTCTRIADKEDFAALREGPCPNCLPSDYVIGVARNRQTEIATPPFIRMNLQTADLSTLPICEKHYLNALAAENVVSQTVDKKDYLITPWGIIHRVLRNHLLIEATEQGRLLNYYKDQPESDLVVCHEHESVS